MKLYWLKAQFTWIGSLSEFEDIPHTKIIQRVKPEVRKLCLHLLELGGEKVVIPYADLWLCEILIDSGKVLSYRKLQIKKAEEQE